MRHVGISVFWTEGPKGDPMVGVKLIGYQGTEEIRKVIEVIEDSLHSSFPGVPVIRHNSAKKIFEPGV